MVEKWSRRRKFAAQGNNVHCFIFKELVRITDARIELVGEEKHFGIFAQSDSCVVNLACSL